uniref:Dockerin domain-containing protein n=1 Tax=uncultured Methanosarcinales archaeon TaxID=183757 RepID=A0A7H1KNF1_9EURY|nr:hypothetical protein EKMJPAOO_00015 [uncultured Methanosarcinales archaeon]
MKIQAIVLVWLLCLLAAGGASAQTSANYALNWSVVGSGGGEMTSSSYAMQSTVGQTAIGLASDGYLIEAGYWYRDAGGESEVCGDVNGDGVVTAADAAIALEIAAGSRPFDAAADVSGDGVVTSLDALMILQAAADAIEI